MNYNKLKGKIIEKGYSMKQFSEAIGISHVSLYRKLKGIREFDRNEIEKISELLCLDNVQIIDIFFNQKVS